MSIVAQIHHFQLERSSSSLADNPLVLVGGQQVRKPVGSHVLQDKVEEFRALCWALYAPPQETALQYNPANFKLDRIMDLFLISHKYRLESLQTFATQLLVHHCSPPYTTCRTPELEKILRLAVLNKALPLIKVAEEALLRRIEEDPLGSISMARLITLAEELGMRKLQGKLYYHELVRDEASTLKIPSSTAYNFPCAENLTEKQTSVLFKGYRSLLRYWRHLPGEAREKKVSKLTSCKNHQICQREWDSAWSVETLKDRDSFPPNLDILASLEKIRTSRPNSLNQTPLFSFGITRAITPAPNTSATPVPISTFPLPNAQPQPWMQPCGEKELNDLVKRLQDTLADHFLGSHVPSA
ncbi:hypothetical protein M413DRAFT_157594 [Hebeloma cylindrosporum]|uniref:BTB domain-containing protein n=1 Tax=Hebeloma cylindrosporum TaxID=76867 RepID=A0A0C2YIU4_HEBCY|nr:hypothetical protein M413DRAFT_157594 [Hebeloma cylindrosporum h7]